MKNIIYENQVLRNTNYYLLCTIYNLEKHKLSNYTELLHTTNDRLAVVETLEPQNEILPFEEFQKETDIQLLRELEEKKKEFDALNEELQNLKHKTETDVQLLRELEEKKKEFDVLNEELQNLKIEMEVQLLRELEEKKKEFDVLNNELQNLKIEMEVQRDFSEHKILKLEIVKNTLEKELLDTQERQDAQDKQDDDELLKKEKEIEKLKRENTMLTINNQQLQYELIRTIKQM